MTRFLILIILLSSVVAHAEDSLWKDNKLTPAQPFPGRVLAVESSWGGYRLIIESIGEGDTTYCIAQVWPGGLPQLDYKVMQKNDLPTPSISIVYLDPAVEIDRFSWSMGPWKIGRSFADDDSLKKVITAEAIPKNQQSEQAKKQANEIAKDIINRQSSPAYNARDGSEEEAIRAATINSEIQLNHVMASGTISEDVRICYALNLIKRSCGFRLIEKPTDSEKELLSQQRVLALRLLAIQKHEGEQE